MDLYQRLKKNNRSSLTEQLNSTGAHEYAQTYRKIHLPRIKADWQDDTDSKILLDAMKWLFFRFFLLPTFSICPWIDKHTQWDNEWSIIDPPTSWHTNIHGQSLNHKPHLSMWACACLFVYAKYNSSVFIRLYQHSSIQCLQLYKIHRNINTWDKSNMWGDF